MKTCRYCRTQRNDGEAVCPNCGASETLLQATLAAAAQYAVPPRPIQTAPRKGLSGGIIAVIVIGAVLLLGGMFFLPALIGIFSLYNTPNSIVVDKPQATKEDIKQDYEQTYKLAQSYIESGDYGKAIEKLRSIPDTYKDYLMVKNKLEEISVQYRQEALADAEALAAQQKYSEAVGVLNAALAVLEKDSDISVKRDFYQDQIPTNFLAEYYGKEIQSDGGWDQRNSATDNFGNEYSDVLMPQSYEISSIEYSFRNKYKKFSGVIFLCNDSKNEEEYTIVYKFYGDGQLLFTSQEFKAGCEPQIFDINVQGVDRLKISCEFLKYKSVFADTKTGLANILLTK